MPKLVYMYTEAEAPMWFRPAYSTVLDTAYYSENTVYAADTVFYYDMYGPYQDLIPAQLAAGYRVIYDAKNEHYMPLDKHWLLTEFKQYPGQGMFLISGHTPKSIPGVHVVATPYWYWIMDAASFENYNYQNRPVNPTHEYRFFMQLSQERKDRSTLYSILEPVLQYSLHSYRSQNKHLPNDVDPAVVHNWQRYMNWDWINSCSITLVVESNLDYLARLTAWSVTEHDNRFICEKTYKPIAYGHAFLMAGTQGNLAHVREQGFETFPELWDESYDDLPLYTVRVAAIRDIIQGFDSRSLEQPRVREKILHNQNRFFSADLRRTLLESTVIEPVVAFVNG